MAHLRNSTAPHLTLTDGGKARRTLRLQVADATAGVIAMRPYKAPIRATKYMYAVSGTRAFGKQKSRRSGKDRYTSSPLGPLERLIAEVCRMRDVIPEDRLADFDAYLYGGYGSAVFDTIESQIDASNERRRVSRRGGAA